MKEPLTRLEADALDRERRFAAFDHTHDIQKEAKQIDTVEELCIQLRKLDSEIINYQYGRHNEFSIAIENAITYLKTKNDELEDEVEALAQTWLVFNEIMISFRHFNGEDKEGFEVYANGYEQARKVFNHAKFFDHVRVSDLRKRNFRMSHFTDIKHSDWLNPMTPDQVLPSLL